MHVRSRGVEAERPEKYIDALGSREVIAVRKMSVSESERVGVRGESENASVRVRVGK